MMYSCCGECAFDRAQFEEINWNDSVDLLKPPSCWLSKNEILTLQRQHPYRVINQLHWHGYFDPPMARGCQCTPKQFVFTSFVRTTLHEFGKTRAEIMKNPANCLDSGVTWLIWHFK